jgi:hypothetical protein
LAEPGPRCALWSIEVPETDKAGAEEATVPGKTTPFCQIEMHRFPRAEDAVGQTIIITLLLVAHWL